MERGKKKKILSLTVRRMTKNKNTERELGVFGDRCLEHRDLLSTDPLLDWLSVLE